MSGLRVYTRPLGNEPIKARKEKAPATKPGQPEAPVAQDAPQAEAGDEKAST